MIAESALLIMVFFKMIGGRSEAHGGVVSLVSLLFCTLFHSFLWSDKKFKQTTTVSNIYIWMITLLLDRRWNRCFVHIQYTTS